MPENSWTAVLPEDDLPEGRPIRATAGGLDVLLYRDANGISAVSNRCTHQGAPLHRGVVRASGSLLTVTCAAHGSQFQLADGRVMRGPATTPLPAYEARLIEGMIEVRPRP